MYRRSARYLTFAPTQSYRPQSRGGSGVDRASRGRNSLLRFRTRISNHTPGGAVLYKYFHFFDPMGHKSGTLITARHSIISFKDDGTLVVFMHQVVINCVPLRIQEVPCPDHVGHGIICHHKFSLKGALRIQLVDMMITEFSPMGKPHQSNFSSKDERRH